MTTLAVLLAYLGYVGALIVGAFCIGALSKKYPSVGEIIMVFFGLPLAAMLVVMATVLLVNSMLEALQ